MKHEQANTLKQQHVVKANQSTNQSHFGTTLKRLSDHARITHACEELALESQNMQAHETQENYYMRAKFDFLMYNNGTGQKSFERHFEMEHCQLMSFIMRAW